MMTMAFETTILKMLISKARMTTVPLWSCRKSDGLCALSIMPQLRNSSTYVDATPLQPSLPSQSSSVNVEMEYGLPHLTVPLPSRNEPCIFALRPITHNVGDLLNMLKLEDPGIDRALVRTTDGTRIASTTSIQTLLQREFDLIVNETSYRVNPSEETKSSSGMSELSFEELQKLGDVRAMVSELFEALHVEQHQAAQEQKLQKELERLQDEVAPFEVKKHSIIEKCLHKSKTWPWIGLGLMGIQFGALARLTWWEYSWDIMEPVTYFVTYGTSIAFFAYFALTRQEFNLSDVNDRRFLITFYKNARKHNWDVEKYNELRDSIEQVEADLKRLRDPLRLTASNLKSVESSILSGQLNIGSLKDMLKTKLTSTL